MSDIVMNRENLKQKSALIDFIQQNAPLYFIGDYHKQIGHLPVHALQEAKDAIIRLKGKTITPTR